MIKELFYSLSRGNMLLVGAVGSHLSTLSRLALHVADIPIHKVDTSKQSNFFDGLRSAIRLSGSEGKVISLLFTVRYQLLILPLFLFLFCPLLFFCCVPSSIHFLTPYSSYHFTCCKLYDIYFLSHL